MTDNRDVPTGMRQWPRPARSCPSIGRPKESTGPLLLSLLLLDENIVLSLTDLRRLVRHGVIPEKGAFLARLRQVCDARFLSIPAATGHGQGIASTKQWGMDLFSFFFPERIGATISRSGTRDLTLQLPIELSWIPFEFMHDAFGFLGERFRVTRQLVGDNETDSAVVVGAGGRSLQVAVLTTGSAAGAETLATRLRTIDRVSCDVYRWPAPSSSSWDHRGMDADIVHCHVAISSVTCDQEEKDAGCLAAAFKGRSEPLRFLVVEDLADHLQDETDLPDSRWTSLATAIGATSVLGCRASADPLAAADFLFACYVQIAAGAMLGEAIRQARIRTREQHGTIALLRVSPEFYGHCAEIFDVHQRTCEPTEDAWRQLTIMSIDLVESTRLLITLGAEQYGERLDAFHARTAAILRRYGGMPDDPQGDDCRICYFGLPHAQEDVAVRAMQAGFELLDDVRNAGLAVRIGISTGEVVVRSGQPWGPAIHLAARLRAVASAGMIIASEATQRIAAHRFQFERIEGGRILKGFPAGEALYRAIGPLSVEPWVDRTDSTDEPSGTRLLPRVTPFVGRDAEREALQAHWNAARCGSLRVVQIVGEAGIGKSRLVREWKRGLGDEVGRVFELRCSPDTSNSAFGPLVDAFRAELRIRSEDDDRTVLQRLHALAFADVPIDEVSLALVADLLGLHVPNPGVLRDLIPERRRQLTIELLVESGRCWARRRPGCLVVEDVHWMDPSTREYLVRLVSIARAEPLLIVLTSRWDVASVMSLRDPVHEIELKSLTPEASRALVRGASGGLPIPNEVVRGIAAHGDGVPLFIEESTRMALEVGGEHVSDMALRSIPATLRDLLSARLDRLGKAKQLAQVGGTIGREFPLSLLASVVADPDSPIAIRDLDVSLEALVRSGMLLLRQGSGEPVYAFKHALVRDAAYRSLLDRTRSRLHRVIARVIGARFGAMVDARPELLAFHFAEAGLESEALQCWEHAARQAASRSAHAEAISHARSALAILERRPPEPERDRHELRIQLFLATRLIALHGYGAPSVERIYARAKSLADGVGDGVALMRILLGLESFHVMRADFEKAEAYAREVASRASGSPDVIQQLQAQWAFANIAMHRGDSEAAVRQMDDCLARCASLEHRPGAVQDPGVMCLCYSAWTMWQLGFPDQALNRVTAVVDLAERRAHLFSLGEAYGFHAAVRHFRGENEEALASVDRAVAICEEGGFVVWQAHAHVMRGRIRADLGHFADGVEEMRCGYTLWADTGAVITTPFYLAMWAEGLALAGRAEEGLERLQDALAIVERTGERYYEAEIRRLDGRLTLQVAAATGVNRLDEVEQRFVESLACARSRGHRSIALRAALNLADLYASQGQCAAAIAILRPAFEAVVEGRSTRDLRAAAERLATLERLAYPRRGPPNRAMRGRRD